MIDGISRGGAHQVRQVRPCTNEESSLVRRTRLAGTTAAVAAVVVAATAAGPDAAGCSWQPLSLHLSRPFSVSLYSSLSLTLFLSHFTSPFCIGKIYEHRQTDRLTSPRCCLSAFAIRR